MPPNSSTVTASGSAVEVTRHQPGRRPDRLPGVADRPLAVQAGRAELDRQVGVQLGIKVLAAFGPRLQPLKYRPHDRSGIEVPACDVEYGGL